MTYLTTAFSPKRARGASEGRSASRGRFCSRLRCIRVGADVELDVARMEARFAGRRVDLDKDRVSSSWPRWRVSLKVFTRAQLLNAVRGVASSHTSGHRRNIKNVRKRGGFFARRALAAIHPDRIRCRLPFAEAPGER